MTDQRTLHILDEETSVEEKQQVEISLPKWAWNFLQARANFHFEGDIILALQEMVTVGTKVIFEASMESLTDVPQPDDKEKWS